MEEQKINITKIINYLEEKKKNQENVEEETLQAILSYLEVEIPEKIKTNEEIKSIFSNIDEVKDFLIKQKNLNARQKSIIRNFDNFNVKYNNGKEQIKETILEGLEITKNNPTEENIRILLEQGQILDNYTTLFIGACSTSLQTPVPPRIQEQANKSPKKVKSLSKKYNK